MPQQSISRSEKKLVLESFNHFSNEQISKVTFINKSYAGNTTYTIHTQKNKYVLKKYNPHKFDTNRLEQIYKIIKSLEKKGIPVPTYLINSKKSYVYLHFDTENHTPITVSRYVPHKKLEAKNYALKTIESIAFTSYKLHQALKDIAPTSAIKTFDYQFWLMRFCNNEEISHMKTIYKTIKGRADNEDELFSKFRIAAYELEKKLAKKKPRSQLIHGDYYDKNILFNKHHEIVSVLDFDEMNISPIEYEIGRGLVNLDLNMPQFTPQKLTNIFVQSYKETIDPSLIIWFMNFRCLYRIYRWFNSNYLPPYSETIEVINMYHSKLLTYLPLLN